MGQDVISGLSCDFLKFFSQSRKSEEATGPVYEAY